jgi:hypothetical protein
VGEIRFIEQHAGYSILRFDNQHFLTIQGPPAALLQANSAAGSSCQPFHKPDAPPSVEDLLGASKRDFHLAAFSMHRDDDLTSAPLFMPVVGQSGSLARSTISEMWRFPLLAPMYL